jgi:hypothetical protein
MVASAILVVCQVVAPTVMLPLTEAEFDAGVTVALAMLIAADVLNLG